MTYLILVAGLPVIIAICVFKALKGTKITEIKKDAKCPTALKASFIQANENPSWNLKK